MHFTSAEILHHGFKCCSKYIQLFKHMKCSIHIKTFSIRDLTDKPNRIESESGEESKRENNISYSPCTYEP